MYAIRSYYAVEMVKRAGANIQHAVEKYLVDNNLSDRLQGYKWEFNLVESEQVNAWCMPGGKVVVVITSYSIHYTKLYEVKLIWNNIFWKTANPILQLF